MIRSALRRCGREPIPFVAVFLFTAILTVILCFLHRSQTEEQANFQNIYDSMPIEFDITWLDGTRLNDSAPASGHMADILPELFLGTSRHEPQFDDLVTDLQIRMSEWGTEIVDDTQQEQTTTWKMVGITTPEAAYDQPSRFGEQIQWYEGYDESILQTEELVCVVPSDYDGSEEVTLTFSFSNDFTCTFRIVGRYSEEGSHQMYCPYGAMAYVYARINQPKAVERLSGRLIDNGDLETFRQRAAEWFATPNPAGEPTPWENNMGYDTYPLAIDIQDEQLKTLTADIENSLTVNRIAAGLVFALSAGAGFLTGFLVIRSRKREITLMRTLGASNGTVCGELALEQLLCVASGVLLGGSYSLWQPAWQLVVFAAVYLAGLVLALLVFTRANLQATIKEDE